MRCCEIRCVQSGIERAQIFNARFTPKPSILGSRNLNTHSLTSSILIPLGVKETNKRERKREIEREREREREIKRDSKPSVANFSQEYGKIRSTDDGMAVC